MGRDIAELTVEGSPAVILNEDEREKRAKDPERCESDRHREGLVGGEAGNCSHSRIIS